MEEQTLVRCSACGWPLPREQNRAGYATLVEEKDARIVLVHCPRCATLHVQVNRTLTPAR